MFASIMNLISTYISYFPLVVFIGLFLGGLNLPISEDVLVIASAIMCQDEKASIPIFLLALYSGATLSDYMVYFWGRLIRKGAVSSRFFSKIINEKNTHRLLLALQRYGIFTYIVTRFIPFGIRNVVSMTSGFVKYPFYKFALYDFVAALCNISLLFSLVYCFGAKGSKIVKIIGITFFVLLLVIIAYLIKSGKLSQITDKKLREKDSIENKN